MEEEWRCTLLKAAKWLEEHNWCRGRLHKGTEASCALGSLRRIHPRKSWDKIPGFLKLTDYCRSLGYTYVPYFNDLVAKDKQEVIDLMRKCATQDLKGESNE